MINVIAADTAATGAIDLNDRTLLIKFINRHASNTSTVTLNNITITLPAGMTNYEDFPGNYDTFTIAGGTVDYVVFG